MKKTQFVFAFATCIIFSLPFAFAIDGSGTVNYLSKFIDASTVGNSAIYEIGDNIGIGTTSPNSISKLTIAPTMSPAVDGSATGLFVQPTINEASSGTHQIFTGAYFATPTINAGDAVVTDAVNVYIQGAPAGGIANLSLFVGSGNSRIRDKLGVGAVSLPDATLTVYGPGDTNFATHIRTSNLPAPYGLWIEEASGGASGYPLLQITDSGSVNTHLRVDSGSYTGMIINSNGNVGIGTVSPSGKLHIATGSSVLGLNVSVSSGTAYAAEINPFRNNPYGLRVFTPAGSGAGYPLIIANTGSSSNFRVDSGAYTGISVTSTGNTGIGTVTPDSLLTVASSGYFQFKATSHGAPTGTDCDSDAERGRLVIDTSNNRMYVCNGAARGWDYTQLID